MSKDEKGTGEPKDVTSNEEKELRRVYDYLANYYPKSRLMKELEPKESRRQKIMQYKKAPDAVKIVDETGTELSPEQIDEELDRLNAECEALQAKIEEYQNASDRKIHPADLSEAILRLGKRCSKVVVS